MICKAAVAYLLAFMISSGACCCQSWASAFSPNKKPEHACCASNKTDKKPCTTCTCKQALNIEKNQFANMDLSSALPVNWQIVYHQDLHINLLNQSLYKVGNSPPIPLRYVHCIYLI